MVLLGELWQVKRRVPSRAPAKVWHHDEAPGVPREGGGDRLCEVSLSEVSALDDVVSSALDSDGQRSWMFLQQKSPQARVAQGPETRDTEGLKFRVLSGITRSIRAQLMIVDSFSSRGTGGGIQIPSTEAASGWDPCVAPNWIRFANSKKGE